MPTDKKMDKRKIILTQDTLTFNKSAIPAQTPPNLRRRVFRYNRSCFDMF